MAMVKMSLDYTDEVANLNRELDETYRAITELTNELHSASEALKQSEEQLERAMQGANIGFWDWDLDNDKMTFDRLWCERMGFSKVDVNRMSNSWRAITSERYQEAIQNRLNEYINGENLYFEAELKTLPYTKDGINVWLLIKGRIIERRDESGVTRITGTILDINARKEAENKVLQLNSELEVRVAERTDELKIARDKADSANRAKSVFLANMSHEIRTPMNAILGYTQLLKREPELTLQQQSDIDIIHRSGEHLLALINDVLEISKIEAGRSQLNIVDFNLKKMLEELERMFRVQVEAKGLVLSVFCDFSIVPQFIHGDEAKIRQILINLIGNATKFTRKGKIEISLQLKDKIGEQYILEFAVKDSGDGISADDVHKIFKSFEQTRTGVEAGGTGLGLPIARQYARLMGGDIDVVSQPGKGSCFRFELKIIASKGDIFEYENERPVIGIANAKKNYKILIVDDQCVNRMLLSRLLTSVGFLVMEATNGVEAIELNEQWKPDLILMDLIMPVMDGFIATKKIRQNSEESNVPIVAISASVLEEEQARLKKVKATDFIHKPFREIDLFKVIGKCLELNYCYKGNGNELEGNTSKVNTEPDCNHLKEKVKALPDEWVSSFKESIINLDIDAINDAIEIVDSLDHGLSLALKEMAEQYDYEGLDDLFCTD